MPSRDGHDKEEIAADWSVRSPQLQLPQEWSGKQISLRETSAIRGPTRGEAP